MAELISAPKNPVPRALREEVADLLLSRWFVRALLATENDRLGLILRAALEMPTVDPPWLGPSAILNDDGLIRSNWVDEHQVITVGAVVCTLEDLLGNCRRLCDQLAFTQTEADMLFGKLRQWIKDFRTTGQTAEDRVPIEYRKKRLTPLRGDAM